jgi:DNA polymerase-3 subunit beta
LRSPRLLVTHVAVNITITKKDLLPLVTRCHGVADKKGAMPVLANILLKAEGNHLKVAATDLYMSVSGQAPAEVDTPGSIAVPAKELLERVKAMPEGPIQITTTDGAQTTLKAVGSPRRYTLHGLPGGEFPALPAPAAGATRLDLPAAVLAALIARTHFSISTDETRAHVNSALLEWDGAGDCVRMVSTDGHRLSKMEVTVPGTSAAAMATAPMLLPLKAIGELRRLLDGVGEGETVGISQSGPDAFFTLAGMNFSVKLVDAQFPPYQQVIPSVCEHELHVPRAVFADALRAVMIASLNGGVKLRLSAGAAGGAMSIIGESPESGTGFDEIPVEYTGGEMTLGFNAKYIRDVLAVIDDEEVIVGLSGELGPVVLRAAVGSVAVGYVAVVMPMRI